jgi:hypothetical protein
MGMTPNTALFHCPNGPLDPRMPLVIEGDGRLDAEVSSPHGPVPVRVMGTGFLAWHPKGRQLVVPQSGRWPEGTLTATPKSFGTAFQAISLTVGPERTFPPPTLAFSPVVLRHPSPPPSPQIAPSAPWFYFPSPPAGSFGVSLGEVTGCGEIVEVLALLSNGAVLGGWTPSGGPAMATVPANIPDGTTVVGAVVRDMVGQAARYGDLPADLAADWMGQPDVPLPPTPPPPTPWWRRLLGR